MKHDRLIGLLSTATLISLTAGWLALPYSHFRWLPELGTTRPVSSIMFTVAFGLILLLQALQNKGRLSAFLRFSYWKRHLEGLPGGWKFLSWWGGLIILGILSALLTVFYGNFFQALNRLLGYLLIFITIYCGLYSVAVLGMEKIAWWASIGYVPMLFYGVIEALATRQVVWAYHVVVFIRSWLIVPFDWVSRVTLFATEPSFVSFQMILLVALFPSLKNNILRLVVVGLVLITAVFATSGIFYILAAAYLVFLILFSLERKKILNLAAFGGIVIVIISALYSLSDAVKGKAIILFESLMRSQRLSDMSISFAIRNNYIKNLIYTVLDTRGLGLGIGQYGHFWKDIFIRHIDYKAYDLTGEVAEELASNNYMRPWSVLFGIGADLGVLGMGLYLGFFYHIFRACRSAHARAIVMVGFLAMVGAYPIVTPHVWLALALMGGAGLFIQASEDSRV